MRNALIAALFASVAVAGTAEARDQIRIVGSSTVFPFSTTVAERFGKTTSFRTPIVEATGSGGGLKLFCAGTGEGHPDIANASRRIKAKEVETCAENGVAGVIEVKVGYDGIVLANSRDTAPMSLTLRDVFLALAHDVPAGTCEKADDCTLKANPYETWKDVNPDLPDVRIEVLGPPATSGTRDAFVELAMEGGCKTFPGIEAMKKADKRAYKKLCHTIREDGAYIEAGENDNLIVQKLTTNPRALGIFGFSFLDQNDDKLQGSAVNGVAPEFEEIADGNYPVSRALFFYVKKAHIGEVPGIAEFIGEFTNEATWGPDGYLADKGLIPMSDTERREWSASANGLQNLSM
ncbi:MAG: PstS family phosphate ABC transporter substrate-binding protein [Alphaproteobacteria bacterium]|nr:PstS family phosphate ABC transporter substrate-binding protein [Alphaproteobacteria bacterium]